MRTGILKYTEVILPAFLSGWLADHARKVAITLRRNVARPERDSIQGLSIVS